MADTSRTVLVVGNDAGLWARLQADLPPRMVIVRSCSPARLESALTDIQPWPWLVTGSGSRFPSRLAELTSRLPIPVFWWHPDCDGLPEHARRFDDWRPMVKAIGQALQPALRGAGFLAVRGVSAGNGSCLRSPELEGLMAAYPYEVPIEPRRVRRVNALMERHGLAWRVVRVGRHGRLLPPA